MSRSGLEAAFAYIAYLFVLPVLLIHFRVINPEWRVIVLLVVSLLIYGIIRRERWSNADMGLKKTACEEVLLYGLFSVLGVAALVLLARIFGFQPIETWWRHPHLLFLFLPISFYQEFAYRGFLVPVLKRAFRSPVAVVGINALVFSLLHVLYPDPAIMLSVSFIAGLAFAGLYYRYPNLLLVSIAHAVVNFAAIYLGFFSAAF